MEKIHLSVIVPAYNEAKRIKASLLDMDKYLSKQDYSYEILVVSDGSKDNTGEVVKNIGLKNVRLIDNKKNHGKGYVTKQGMLEAKGDYRIYVDADNAISMDHIEKFWPHTNNFDIIIGSIEVKGAKIQEHAGWHRRFLGKISKYLIRFIAGIWEIKDSQRAFKLFPAKVVKDVFPHQTLERWGFDFEILAISKKLGYKIKELPVEWINAEGSKVGLKAYFRTFIELFKIRWNFITNKYKL